MRSIDDEHCDSHVSYMEVECIAGYLKHFMIGYFINYSIYQYYNAEFL